MSRPFKVIVIGAGPAGLALAHMLHLADIDYVVYEKREEAVHVGGTALGIQPSGMRILDQLGLLEAARPLAPPIVENKTMGSDGETLIAYPSNTRLRENHGYDLWLFERWEYLRLLYEQLPDREERIRTGKAIKSLQTLSDEVKVTFEDGSEDHGSIVVGADGIHSTVRRLLREASNDAFPNTGFSSSFMGIYGIGPLPKGVPSERLMEISNFGFWIHLFTQPGRVFWIVYKARDKPVHEFRRYSDAERDEFAKQFDDCPVGNGVTFGQVRQGRWREYLTDFEEGQLPEWHWDRVVLLGDAIHKATPNLAFGAEMAMESGVQLVNVLKSLLKDNAHPDTQSIETAFKEYQDRREAPTKAFINATSDHLRLLAGTAAFSRFILRYLLPMIGTRWILDNQVAPLFAQSPKLDFVPMPRQLDYRVPYHDDVVMQPPSKASLASLWEWLWGSKPSADKTLRAESETQ